MDPVSLTASAITVIGACQQLSTCFKFLRELSKAPEDILALTDELNDLQNVLSAVCLVARQRRDDMLGDLLSPLFHKVDCIIEELCGLCGVCPRRLQEEKDHVEQLKFHLLARFKWTRAKDRVGELRGRLKVVRLDFANQLAAVTLLDISSLTAEFRTFTTELLNTQQGRLQLDPPEYVVVNPSTMQITRSSHQEADLEAQRRGKDVVAQRTFVSEAKSSLDYKPINPCKRACSCTCHKVYRLKSPSVLHNVVGSLLVKSNGLYGLSQPCNEFSCQSNSSASIRLSYRFPEWLLNRMVSSIVISNQLTGPQLSLVAPRIVSYKSKIFESAFAGNIDGIARLFELGLASPCDVSDDWGYTPLHYAVDKGHMNLCRFLLKAGARPDITDLDENSVTDLAYNKIISKRVSPDEAAELEEMFNKDDWFEERQFSILHKIVLDLLPTPRDLDHELSASTKNIDLGDSEGRTPLSWAAERGNVQALEILLCYGADASSRSITGLTPLHYAAKAPTPTGLSILLKHGALATAMNKWNQGPLNIASYFQNDPAYISPLVDAGADINERDCGGCSVLTSATFMNNVRTARYLLSQGADINCQDGAGATALNYSIRNNSYDCTVLLLELGADLSLEDYEGETALHYLARHADIRTLEIFQAADLEDMNPDAETNARLTAWDLMKQRVDMNEEVESAFRSLMAKLDSKSFCVDFFDASEKLPMSVGKVPDLVEVRVEEIIC